MKIKFIHFLDGKVIRPDDCKVVDNQNMPGFIIIETESGRTYYSQAAIKFIVSEWGIDD
ncbi:MAG: hypothetical protein PWR12_696 [Eubacteriaceae bacterium]|jgi:hypothetical protein|nr:hypothetical protein [Eubacteriaceae bacterium]MDK2904620.1 hypothetical protein [Eubacteriaceae bacterium]MDK2935348.1 hypothetical protein [Eubacteriaceae bacterium]MDK2961608.1 hypothetical protein [Eubacteriaceae bacterium]